MKAISIRNVDAKLANALERESSRRSASLNETVLQLLRQALGVDTTARRSNGLGKLAGGWTAREFDAFEANTQPFAQIDEGLWR